MLIGWREHVENATACGYLSASLDEIDTLVAQTHQSLNNFHRVALIINAQAHGLRITDADDDRLSDCADRGDDAIDRPDQRISGVGVSKTAQHRNSSSHGVERRRQPLMGQRLPRREHLDVRIDDQLA